MAHRLNWLASPSQRQWLEHSARTTVAAVVSLAVARFFRLPEAYWAAITTLVVMHSTLGATWAVSGQRFIGTALGAAAGALLAGYFPPGVMVFAAGVFVLGLLCAALGLERSAYRFAGITLAIVMLVARAEPAWMIAFHRFIEVSIGIAVGLALAAAWPERRAPAPGQRASSSAPPR
jgi:uncharacterized membrane protein YccC